MRRLTVPASAACVALMLAACGGSAGHAPARTLTSTISSATTTVQARTTPPPTPAEIERAATLTAAEPGFKARVDASIGLPQFNGSSVTAIGSGHFDPASGSGTLDLAIGLPGLLGLAGPLPAQVRLVGGEAYVQVPADIAGQLPASDAWLQDSISALGLGDSLDPPEILRDVARDATQAVPGQRARVTLDPSTGLVRTIVLRWVVGGGYHAHVRLTLTGFGAQPATTPPSPAQTGDLRTALQALGF